MARGYAIDIVDRGLGMPPELMQQLNERLSRAPEFDLAKSDQLGLLVVSQLAAKHGIKVSLRPSPYGGTAAVVLFPADLVADETQVAMPAAPSAREIRRTRDAPTVPRNTSEPANGLARRQRQAGIAWEAARPSAEAQSERSPEHARSLTSALQRGWRAGRATTTEDDDNSR